MTDVAAPRTNLLSLDHEGLRAFFAGLGEKPFRATQVLKWIYQMGVGDFDAMTNLSKALRDQLKAQAVIEAPRVISDHTAVDGTRKWLLGLADGNAVETVFIPEQDRGTLCVSSQVGCVLNCAFCSTGHQGFNRNLDVHEIIGQLWVANREMGWLPQGERHVTNVVMMGMGEPLLNFENVTTAMGLMLDDNAYGLSKRRVTLSTAGVVPMIDKLAETLQVSLAVSLHAANDALRDEIVPINRKYPIRELLAACRRYVADQPRGRVTFEYVMLDGINDRDEDARALVKLLRDVPAKINLIPFNPFPQSQYRRSSQARIDRFRMILIDAGLTTITRKTRGDDIDAACGQLAGRVADRSARTQRLQAGHRIAT